MVGDLVYKVQGKEKNQAKVPTIKYKDSTTFFIFLSDYSTFSYLNVNKLMLQYEMKLLKVTTFVLV